MTSIDAREDDPALAEAGAWLARLQGADVSDDDSVAFDAWLATPANRAAYGRALATWHAYEASAAEVLADLDAPKRRQAARGFAMRRWAIGAGGVAIAAGLALAVLPGLLAKPTVTNYATGKGQHQRIALADGSVVDINAETRLTVALGRGTRRVTLSDGEAIFDVAHDAKRPFIVAAANREVRVVGTQFDVRWDPLESTCRHASLSIL